MKNEGIHCYISGRVQGVFYRDSTRKRAIELGITGFVKNLPDGRVELMAFGSEEKLKELETWLWQGPPRAKVESVTCEKIPAKDNLRSFEIIS